MSRKLTDEEKEARKKSREQTKKFDRQIRYFMATIFLFVGLFAAIRLSHISADSALCCGFVCGIGYAMIYQIKI